MLSFHRSPNFRGYNGRVRLRCATVALILCAPLLAQPAPPACPADRPVDDFIADIRKQQSKMGSRNKNPLPESICIFGWCRGAHTSSVPQTAPRAETSQRADTPPDSSASSSKPALSKCDEAMERSLDAAHSVEVGDYYFADKNYRAALMRYQDALEQKPQDAAIHVRLGRVLEKLKQIPQALDHYAAAAKLPAPEKWVQEARDAQARLQGHK